MLKINLGSTTSQETVYAEINTTPAEVLSSNGMTPDGHVISLGMRQLSRTELNMTFEELGQTDGSTINMISCVKAESAFKVDRAANVLTVNTEIPKSVIDKGIVQLKDYDNKGNETFVVGKGNGEICDFGLFCNTTDEDDNLCVTIILPMGTTEDQVKARYGQLLVDAKAHVEAIAAKAIEDAAAVDALFAAE